MNPRRILAVARAHVQSLSRRKLALVMLIGLPMMFYFASFSPEMGISFATVGFGWSVAIISLFSTHGFAPITNRLALDGFRAADIVIGRLLSIAAYALGFGIPLWLFLRTDDVVIAPGDLVWSLTYSFLGSCTTGLAIGALLKREMEAMLLLIAIVALTLVVDWSSTLAKFLPMYAADRYAWASVEGMLQPDPQPWRSTLVVAFVLAAIAVLATVHAFPKVNRQRDEAVVMSSEAPLNQAVT